MSTKILSQLLTIFFAPIFMAVAGLIIYGLASVELIP